MKKIMAAFIIVAVLFVAGCIEKNEPEVKYVCPDGSVVSEPSLCNAEANETEESVVTEIENEDVLEITNNTQSLSSSGNYLYINGIVQNHGLCVARFVKVNAKFYKENQVIDQYFESVDGIYINPGKTSTFQIMLKPMEYDHYTLVAYGECFEEIMYSEEIVVKK